MQSPNILNALEPKAEAEVHLSNPSPPEKTVNLEADHWERKYPPIPGESALERKRRLHRIANQKNKYKNNPTRNPFTRLRNTLFFTKESILANCIRNPVTGCLEWQKCLNDAGYGNATENKKRVKIHRRAWELWVGPIPDGLFVCHKCDNRKCCEITHLFLGTDLDNMTDMHNKGRWTVPNRKLNDDQARKIRVDDRTYREISESYGVSQSVVHSIKGGRTYKSA